MSNALAPLSVAQADGGSTSLQPLKPCFGHAGLRLVKLITGCKVHCLLLFVTIKGEGVGRVAVFLGVCFILFFL